MKTLYFIEVTDTFAGEANYSWVTRSIIAARSIHGVLCILSRESGLNFHSVGAERFDSKSGACCAFIREFDLDTDNDYIRYARDDRPANIAAR